MAKNRQNGGFSPFWAIFDGSGSGGGGGRGYDYDPWGGNGNQFSRPPPTMQRGYYH